MGLDEALLTTASRAGQASLRFYTWDGPLGDGPRFEHTTHLESQVPVEPARSVLVDNEEARSGAGTAAERFGTGVSGSLCPVCT